MTSSPMYQRGDIVLVDFIADVTSNLAPPFRPGDTLLKDWAAAGLLKPSAVRGILATQNRLEIVRRIGRLSDADFVKVERAIAGILGLWHEGDMQS